MAPEQEQEIQARVLMENTMALLLEAHETRSQRRQKVQGGTWNKFERDHNEYFRKRFILE